MNIPEHLFYTKDHEWIKIDENNATSISDMGKIMSITMSKFSGSIDGNIVQKIVKEELNK